MEDLDPTFFQRLCSDERRASVGYEHDEELYAQREQALNYYKGEMPDVKALPNRSKACSSDVSDAVETVMPDLLEIFTASDDVATFSPVGPEDEEAASQESDYLNHVVYEQNAGWFQLYTAFKDALLVKTGLWKWWWDDYRYTEETIEGLNLVQFQQLVMQSEDPTSGFEIVEVEEGEPTDLGAMVSVTIRQRDGGGKACFEAVDPVDLMVGRDTVRLSEATYVAHRTRVRAQSLIEQGYDPDVIAKLPSYDSDESEEIEQARDTAGETDEEGETNILRMVEVIEHYVRVDYNEDGQTELYKVLTGGDEAVVVDIEAVDSIPFAAITPYPVAHRFFGRSLADLMIEIQKIKTALLRLMLDSGYFALNQRVEVNMERANEFTITDLLNNTPGRPIRSKGEAVKPIGAGSLNFDVQGALEYVATMGEQRSGIVRNAQGLNPDTLHDTKGGAEMLASAAQKRVRMIARVFAETGVKDLFMGLHDMLRKHGTEVETVKLKGAWVPVSPASWRRRKDMTIDIGVGSGGRQEELAAIRELAGMMQQVMALQERLTGNPLGGPYVTPQNFYEFGKRYLERLGIKAVDAVWTEPDAEQMQAMLMSQQQQENPAQAEMAKAQGKMQADIMKLNTDAEIAKYKADLEAQLEIRKQDIEASLSARGQDVQMQDVRFGGQVG